MDMKINAQDKYKAGLVASPELVIGNAAATTHYQMRCFDKFGNLKWDEEFFNLITTVGLNELLDKTFKASAYTAAWYVGLKGSGSLVAGDTMGSHINWSEITDYDEATRPALTLGTPSGGSVGNSGNEATFTFNAGATVAGAFIADDDTRGGTTGVLYGGGDFSAARSVVSSDVLNVTATLTITSA